MISLGTGRDPQAVHPGEAEKLHTWDWLWPLMDAFTASTGDQQVHLVETFFKGLDFRRFQVNLRERIPFDDPAGIPKLVGYGNTMGRMILTDQVDVAMGVKPTQIQGPLPPTL